MIKLTQGYNCLIDESDFLTFSVNSWYASVKSNGVYACRTQRYGPRREGKKKIIYLHREIVGAKTGEYVDHINGNTLDNRKSNLRICSHKQNIRNNNSKNLKKNKFKGVYRTKYSIFSKITVNYKEIYLGTFKNEIDAAKAYNKAAKQYFGKYARLNDV